MNSVIPDVSAGHSTTSVTVVLEPSVSLPSFPLAAIIEAMSERWDDHAAEDLVSGYMSDLSDASPSGRPMDPPRAAEANETISHALGERDPRLLERGLREAERAWREEPAEGYPAPDYPDGPDE